MAHGQSRPHNHFGGAMKAIELDSHPTVRPVADNAWQRPRTLNVQARTTACSFGYPSPRPYHAPTDADRLAEEPERWDGLS
jgi:hypothetical protein